MANFSAFSIADVVVNPKGAKIATLTADGQPVTLTLGSKEWPLRAPFAPSVFDGTESARVNFDLRLDAKGLEWLEGFDSWAIQYIHANCERLLKKSLSLEQVKEYYKPTITLRGSYPSTVRTKLNIRGHRQVRCWDQHLKPRETPDEKWTMCEYVAQVAISHMWIMNREFGFVLQCTDLMVVEPEIVCPF